MKKKERCTKVKERKGNRKEVRVRTKEEGERREGRRKKIGENRKK